MLEVILNTFTRKFNWAYYDGYSSNQIGQVVFRFTFILLEKYGKKKLLDSFYAEKYFNAFPYLLEVNMPAWDSIQKNLTRCYSVRFFERFLDYFGLIGIDKVGLFYDEILHIPKTDLFDKLIQVHHIFE